MNDPSPIANVPTNRTDRWSLLRQVAAQWYSPIAPGDRVPDADLDSAKARSTARFPAAFREWYAVAGRRADIWSRQVHFLQPSELRLDGDHLVFLVENQAIVQWGIRTDHLTSEDPPVFPSDAIGQVR